MSHVGMVTILLSYVMHEYNYRDIRKAQSELVEIFDLNYHPFPIINLLWDQNVLSSYPVLSHILHVLLNDLVPFIL